MPMSPDLSLRHWLGQLVDRYQIVLAPAEFESTAALIARLRETIAALPDPLPPPEGVILASLVAHLTLTAPAPAGTLDPRRVAGSQRLTPSELLEFVDLWSRPRRELSGDGGDVCHIGARRALECIRLQYADARLTLGRVAQTVGLSPYHLAHLLKKHTGRAFLWHLHEARVDASKRLLETPSSIKEIAAQVGYNDSTQFGRHFKRRVGLSPLRYRARVLSRERHSPVA